YSLWPLSKMRPSCGTVVRCSLFLSSCSTRTCPAFQPDYILQMSQDGPHTPAPHASALPTDHGPTLLVLHINDSTDDQVLFQTACKHAKVPFAWHVTDSAEKAKSYLDTLLKVDRLHAVRWPDLIVLDIVMPGESGLKVLEYIRSTPELQRLPVVIF